MSELFDDDFTAELKTYFLENLILEIEDDIDLIDDSIWARIRSESTKQAIQTWAVDARTNEFLHLAEWLENFEEKTASLQNALDFKKYLEALKGYVNALLVEKSDTPELAAKFLSLGQSNEEILFLHCQFGGQRFAVPLLNVVEISSNRPLCALPEKKAGLLGVIPFRGDAIPVISFEDHGFVPADSNHICYVICEVEGLRFSLQVTGTDDLLKLRESELQNIEEQSSLIQTSFVKQFFVKDNQNIMILDLEKLVA